MPLQISRLRRWFAIAAIAMVAVVVGAYFYAQYRVRQTIKHIPEKLGLDIEKSLNGFTLAPSVGGHTIFKLQAKKAVQFKLDGHAELHDVTIILYGRDASRFDRISGSDFEYDMKSGDITAKGNVDIDLEANPVGLAGPDQSQPTDLKNPIHVKTSGIVFNQKTGDAHTDQKVAFNIPQAHGSAVGVSYSSKNNLLTLGSEIEIVATGSDAALVKATHGTINKDPRSVVLEGVHFEREAQILDASTATFDLNDDNVLQQVHASGNVHMQMQGKQPAEIHANEMDLAFTGEETTLTSVIFSGDVQMQNTGTKSMQGSAGRLVLTYVGKNILQKARLEENVKLIQHPRPGASAEKAQEMELSAAAVDFAIAGGKRLTHAETSGAAQVAFRPVAPNAGRTLITAGVFQAQFDKQGQLASVHGAPNVSIASSNPKQPDRVSTSDSLEAVLGKDKNIQSITQQGNFIYTDGDRKATADRANYTPSTQMLELTGSPRIMDRGMMTTANAIHMNRATGDGVAEGNVKSTYSNLKAQPSGALLASSSPIHITANAMTAHRTAANALYTGDVRLWQEANAIEAPSMEFDRNQRSITALGSAEGQVSTVLVQVNKRGQVTPVTMISSRLTYVDSQRKAQFSGGVTVKASDFVMTAQEMDVFLQSRDNTATTATTQNQLSAAVGKLDRIAAHGQVMITQPTRKATGDQLVYTAAEDKFVLTGGPPSIFDAERGKITGVSLTLFRGDDRVLVEGTDTSPSVTQTRVAR